jgi:hypothetical protein
MFFLLRMGFWLSIVLILLPTGSAPRGPATSDVGASDAISAASATVGDLRQFCTRQPDACTVGSQVATEMGYKAQAGAKMLYDFLTETLAPHETGSLASRGGQHTADGKPALDVSTIENGSQNTLKPNDLAPTWHAPAARKDGRHSI